ncbi:hypothetical protein ACFZAM_31870 [Streptomyces sp. NPDC008079]|uniref:hypothetical protein n=1 Tax=Streptomyces sp. NPDC008079 TaxID=3364806 RepID=UPI0036E6DBFF
MAKKIVVHLATGERFQLWGQRIIKVTLIGREAAVFSWRGFVGTVNPTNVPEIANALEARKSHIRYDDSEGFVRSAPGADDTAELRRLAAGVAEDWTAKTTSARTDGTRSC